MAGDIQKPEPTWAEIMAKQQQRQQQHQQQHQQQQQGKIGGREAMEWTDKTPVDKVHERLMKVLKKGSENSEAFDIDKSKGRPR